MPTFSRRSLNVLSELHPHLRAVAWEAINKIDFTLLDAQRGRAEQEKAFRLGYSKAHFGQSAHNYVPAVAFDLVPYPIDFDDYRKFQRIAQVIMPVAKKLKVPIRWGADWDMDGDYKDENFLDWGHYELHPWRQWAAEGQLIED